MSAEEVKPYSDIQVGRQKSAEVIVFGIRAGKKKCRRTHEQRRTEHGVLVNQVKKRCATESSQPHKGSAL